MGQRAGIADPEVLQELQALGFTPDAVVLLPLVPAVQMWKPCACSTERHRPHQALGAARPCRPRVILAALPACGRVHRQGPRLPQQPGPTWSGALKVRACSER
jgi:hypothetical protein